MRALLIVALLSSSAYAQTITVTRGEWTRTIYNADFTTLERVIEVEGQPGDVVRFVGTFTSKPLDVLDLNKIVGGAFTGDGPDKSRLILTARHDRIGPETNPDKPAGPALWLPDNGVMHISNVYLENTPTETAEDGALAGWPGSQAGTSVSTFEDCEVKAHDWGLIYDWSLRSNRTVLLRRVKGVAARTFISLVHSASKYNLLMEDCDIGIDGNLSVSIGASSAADPVTGGIYCPILMRAGTGHVENCTFWVKGMTPPPNHPTRFVPVRAVTIATDQYYSQGSRSTLFTAKNCRVTGFEPNAATVSYDLDFRYGKGTIDNLEQVAAAQIAVQPLRDEADAKVAAARGGTGEGGAIKVWVPDAN